MEFWGVTMKFNKVFKTAVDKDVWESKVKPIREIIRRLKEKRKELGKYTDDKQLAGKKFYDSFFSPEFRSAFEKATDMHVFFEDIMEYENEDYRYMDGLRAILNTYKFWDIFIKSYTPDTKIEDFDYMLGRCISYFESVVNTQ